MSDLAGLFLVDSRNAAGAVPLVGVDVHAIVTHTSSAVTLRQRFRNHGPTPIEAVYVFPLPTDAAIHGFTAERDGVRIEGRIAERDKAFEVYDDALADGHGAFLVDQERPNVFTVSVGNLAPGQDVTLELRWVAPLDREGDAVRFMLPTTVSPRYSPTTVPTIVGQPDHERLNPERLPHVPYGLRLTLDVTTSSLRVESPSHAIRTTLPTPTTPMRVELAHDIVALDRDFVVLLTPSVQAPALSVGRTERARYLELAFVPTMEPSSEGIDVVFVVDCSGSMSGESIDQALRALRLCVSALDERDTFDIVRFGSSHQALFGRATPYTKDSFAKASAFMDATDAVLGGTEILAPLQNICARPTTRPTNILLLTDGQVSNESEVIALADAHRANTRFFTFGIGAGVSEHLVKEVARTSRGRCELIAPGERIEPKVLRQFGRVRSPLIDVRIDWGALVVDVAPREVPGLFPGEPLVVRAKVLGGQPSGEVVLSAAGRRFGIPLESAHLETASTGGPVPAMWAREKLRDLENSSGRRGSAQGRATSGADRLRQALLDVALEHSLMSSVTSFVAVELRSNADKTFNPELRNVPVALTAGWGGTTSGAPPRPAPRPMVAARSGGAPAPARPVPSMMDAMPSASTAPAEPLARKRSGPSLLKKLASAFSPGESAPRRARVADSEASPESASFADVAATPRRAHRASLGQDDTLYDVLLVQEVDGSFPRQTLSLLEIDADRLVSLITRHGAAAVYTTAVLFVLERDHRARKDEWRAAAEKARRFLERFGPIDLADLI